MSRKSYTNAVNNEEAVLIERAHAALKAAKKELKACYVATNDDSNEECFQEAISAIQDVADVLPQIPETPEQRRARKENEAQNWETDDL